MSKSLIQDVNNSEIVLTSTLSVDFLKLLESEQHSDVCFLVGSEKILGEKKKAKICVVFLCWTLYNFEMFHSSQTHSGSEVRLLSGDAVWWTQ